MDTTTTYVIIALAVAAMVIVALVVMQRRKTTKLKAHFGTEYDRAVVDSGGRGKAEAGLVAAQKHVQKLSIRELEPSEREFFRTSWDKIQGKFVDDPALSVTEADQLVGVVMSACGYAVTDFEQRAADISVDHPEIVQHYRAGHAIALQQERGEATTEDLRTAMISYRTLFEDLVGEPEPAPVKLAS